MGCTPNEGRLDGGVLQTTSIGGMVWPKIKIWNLLLQMQLKTNLKKKVN